MTIPNNNFEKYIPKKNSEGYVNAVKDFTHLTIQDPSFFTKSQEEQIEIARNILKSSKGELKQNETL